MIIERKKYLDQLMAKRWNGKVKIITGIIPFLLSGVMEELVER